MSTRTAEPHRRAMAKESHTNLNRQGLYECSGRNVLACCLPSPVATGRQGDLLTATVFRQSDIGDAEFSCESVHWRGPGNGANPADLLARSHGLQRNVRQSD